MEDLMSRLRPGQSGRVLKILTGKDMRRRLLEIGLIKGSRILCVGRSPLGGMGAYEIMGAVMALRDSDCEKIIIEREETDDEKI